MSDYILFYRETTTFDVYAWLDRYIADFGMVPMIIDRIGDFKSKQLKIYKKIEDAVEDNSGYNFVWLDKEASIFLDEYQHKGDNTIYCVGSDYDGFDGKDFLDGEVVKIRGFEYSIYSSMVIPMICYDRFLYLNGRRS